MMQGNLTLLINTGKTMRNKCFILIGLWLGLAGCLLTAERPNVVLVITDDQGYGDLSCHGNPVLKTPHLDRLHAESVRLTDYHVSPTCSPTRSALITGHWTNRTGVWHTIMGRSLLRVNEVTIGTILGDAGYATGMFGKWHLGDNYPYRPEDRGFQETFRHGGGGVGQTPDYWDNAYFDGSYWHNGTPKPAKGFCTDVFFDAAIQFIESQRKAKRPFFVYLCTNAPHGPMHAPPESSRPYQQLGTHLANFYGMIANIDDNVGRLRRYLRESGLDENTLFIFTTDNGTAGGEKIFNAGMRGKKGSEYDGGHRVPFFIHWPKGGLTGGRDVPTLTAHVDVVPTLIDLCAVPSPKNVKFDGASLRPLLFPQTANASSSNPSQWPDRILVTDSQRVRDPIQWRKSSVMTDQYRLINGRELYDIRQDPAQKKNVAADNPAVVARLRNFYERWWAELDPTFSQTAEIYLGHPQEQAVRLTCHDWIADGSTPWNQRAIRNAERRANLTGFWAVKVIEAGDYEVELRRWPREIDHPIDAGLPAGEDVPGATAFRAAPGKVFPAVSASLALGGQTLTKPVRKGASAVAFRLTLQRGSGQLWAKFQDAEGGEMGAFYAYVRKL